MVRNGMLLQFHQQLTTIVALREGLSALNILCMSGPPREDGGASLDTGRGTLP